MMKLNFEVYIIHSKLNNEQRGHEFKKKKSQGEVYEIIWRQKRDGQMI